MCIAETKSKMKVFVKDEKWEKTTVNINWCALRSNFDRMQACMYSCSRRFFSLTSRRVFFFALSVLLLVTDCNRPCGYDIGCESMFFSRFIVLTMIGRKKRGGKRDRKNLTLNSIFDFRFPPAVIQSIIVIRHPVNEEAFFFVFNSWTKKTLFKSIL